MKDQITSGGVQPDQAESAQSGSVQSGGVQSDECRSVFAGVWPDVDRFLPRAALARLRELAVAADREGRMSSDGLDVLKQQGWPGLAVPTKFGGLGASLLECCAVQRQLGAADPGLAIAGTMHLGSVGVWAEHYKRTPDMTWVFMEAVAAHRLIVASAVAEPSLGGSVTRSTLRATRVEGGWEVSGKKSPLSFASNADLITLQMQSSATDARPSEVLVALVPRSLPGISSVSTWDTLGMRGSGSDTLVLDRCVVPDPLVVYQGPPGSADSDDMAAGVTWFSLVITATYLGLLSAALDEARRLLTTSRIAHLNAQRAELPSYQHLIGEELAKLLTLEAACAGLAARIDGGVGAHTLVAAALGLKQHAIRVVPQVVGTFAEACGGPSYARASSLERFLRDAAAVRYHPPTSVPVAQYLGRSGLGLKAALDLDELAPTLRRSDVN